MTFDQQLLKIDRLFSVFLACILGSYSPFLMNHLTDENSDAVYESTPTEVGSSRITLYRPRKAIENLWLVNLRPSKHSG